MFAFKSLSLHKSNVCSSNYHLCYKTFELQDIIPGNKKTTFRDTSLFHFLEALKPLQPCFHPAVMFLLRSNIHNLLLLIVVRKP